MYKKVINTLTGLVFENQIMRVSDNAYIPFDPRNSDYQQYLVWISEGNVPEPAEQ